MILNRREFLKISGLTGLGTITNLTAFAQTFDGIPPEEQNFIPVIGILPNLDSIKENGIHLRWNLPPSKGIPLNTTIYRRIAGPKKNNLFIRPADSNNPTFPVQLNDIYFAGSLANFRLTQTTYGKCYETTYFASTNTLRITFPHVVNFCNVQLGLINPLVAKAFYQDGTLAQEIIIESSLTYKSLLFHSDNRRGIKYIEIPTNFKYFYFLEYNGNQYLCNSQGWERIGFIDNVTDIKVDAGKDVKDVRFNKLFDRLPRNVRNYYVKTDADRDKYKNQAGAYRGLMNAFFNPTNSLFLSDINYPSIADIPPDKLIFKSNNGNTTKINAWNLLMMGSTDPNNARLLGLYFVDKSASGEIYDYKIETNYFIKNKPVTICGVVEGIGGAYTSLPILKPALTAIQMQQTWWEFDKDFSESHYAKVRLFWKIADQYLANNPLTKYTNPIVFDLKIDSGISRQIIPQEENNFQYFLDQKVVLKDIPIQYTLTGVDIFGQESNKLITPIKLFDKDIPPPPVKLQFNSVGNKVFLQFEYGGYQYLSDPQIKKFTAFQKNDSLYTINKKVAYNSFLNVGNNENGYKIFSINLSETIRPNFYKTLHFQERNNGTKLPAKQRKAFKILNTNERTIMFVCTHDQKYIPNNNGIVILGADITDKNEGWNNVGFVNTIVPVFSSLENYVHFNLNSTDINHAKGNVLNDNNCLHAIVLSSIQKHKRENKDLFESEIAPKSSFPEEYTELKIDRTILESNIFTEGSFVFNGNTYKILAQNAGDGHSTDMRFKTTLVVEGHININNNTAIKLSLPTTESTNGYIKNWAIFRLRDNVSLRNKANGEFLLRGTKNNLIKDTVVPEQRYVIAQLFSDCYVYNGQLEVLVKIGTAVSYLPTTVTALVSNKVLYFAPYNIEVTNKINEITLNAKESYKNAHFAIETSDLKDNKSNLSLIAQFIKTRSKNEKPYTPAAPYPCGNKLATEAFMGLPNAETTATFCLEWETMPDLRYEVGRALDKTIITVHKDLWLKGIEINPFESSLRIIGTSLTVQSANENTGLIPVSFSNNAITNIETYKGGRLIQNIGSITIGFEIIQISKVDSTVNVILRPLIKSTKPSATSFNIDKLPNYLAIHDDTAQLKSIAEKCEAAFSIVTGQPLRGGNQYLDEIKGSGNSRYFYKVRAVDASENRSEWSPASVSIWWVDTSVPEMPIEFGVEIGDRMSRLFWKKTKISSLFHSFEIFRFENELPTNLELNLPNFIIFKDQLIPRSIVARAGIISIPEKIKILIPGGLSTIQERVNQLILGLNISIQYLENIGQNLYDSTKYLINYEIVDNDSAIQINRIKTTENNVLIDDKPLSISINGKIIDNQPNFWMFEDLNLEGGKKYFYFICEVKRIPSNQFIKGNLSNVLSVIGIDRSVPVAPEIMVSWVDINDAATLSISNAVRAKIEIRTPATSAYIKILIERKQQTDANWSSITINGLRDWIIRSESSFYFDNEAISNNSYLYRVKYITTNLRISSFSNDLLLNSL